MKQTPSSLRNIIRAFLKDQYNVADFRITMAVPFSNDTKWSVLVSYEEEVKGELLGSFKVLRADQPIRVRKGLYLTIVDQTGEIESWRDV